MNFLFLGYHYLGSLASLAIWLAKQGHEVLYASSRSGNQSMPVFEGIKRVILKRFSPSARGGCALDALENAVQAARSAQTSFKAIKESGFLPDLILSESSGGAALSLPAVFPSSYWLNFMETAVLKKDFSPNKPVSFLQLGLAQRNYVFLPSLRDLRFSPWNASLEVFPPVVDCRFFSPSARLSGKSCNIFCPQNCEESFIRSIVGGMPPSDCLILVDNAHAVRSLSALAREGFKIMFCASMEENRELFRKARLAFFDFPGEKLLRAMACACPSFATDRIPAEDLPPGVISLPPSAEKICQLAADPAFLEQYGKKCRAIVLKHCNLEKIIPVWLRNVYLAAAEWRTDLKHAL